MTTGVRLAVLGLLAVLLALYLWERHKRKQAEALLVAGAEGSAVNAEEADTEGRRVESLELERAKSVVAVYADARAEAKKVTDAKEAVDRMSGSLGKLRVDDPDKSR